MQAQVRYSVLGQGTQTGGASSLEDARNTKKQLGQLIHERTSGQKEHVRYQSQERAVIDMLERNMIADIDYSSMLCLDFRDPQDPRPREAPARAERQEIPASIQESLPEDRRAGARQTESAGEVSDRKARTRGQGTQRQQKQEQISQKDLGNPQLLEEQIKTRFSRRVREPHQVSQGPSRPEGWDQ